MSLLSLPDDTLKNVLLNSAFQDPRTVTMLRSTNSRIRKIFEESQFKQEVHRSLSPEPEMPLTLPPVIVRHVQRRERPVTLLGTNLIQLWNVLNCNL